MFDRKVRISAAIDRWEGEGGREGGREGGGEGGRERCQIIQAQVYLLTFFLIV